MNYLSPRAIGALLHSVAAPTRRRSVTIPQHTTDPVRLLDHHTNMWALNPSGFRKPKTGKHRKHLPQAPTRMEQLARLAYGE